MSSLLRSAVLATSSMTMETIWTGVSVHSEHWIMDVSSWSPSPNEDDE